jgi:hypothetical protein
LLAQLVLLTNLKRLFTYLQLTTTHQAVITSTSSNNKQTPQQQASKQRRADNQANDAAAVKWTYKHP